MVLTMVHNTQNHWVFGIFPSCGILKNRKHDVSETGSASEMSCFLFCRIPESGKSPISESGSTDVHFFANSLGSIFLEHTI
jgi:hypothetical protein